jgi:hypothetical protein
MKSYNTEPPGGGAVDSQRGHCRPRRHGENPARVVVAVHRGDDAAAGESGGRLHGYRLGRRRNRAENIDQHRRRVCRMAGAGQPEKTKINLLDTPGYSTFLNETKSSLIAADAALIVVDAAAGVQVVTEKVWDYATEYDQPRAFLLNWMDRELASFDRALRIAAARVRTRRGADSAADRFGARVFAAWWIDHDEGAALHAGWRRQSEDRGDSRRAGRPAKTGARGAGGDW